MQTTSKVVTRVVLSSPSERNNTVPSTEALLKLPDQEQTASLPLEMLFLDPMSLSLDKRSLENPLYVLQAPRISDSS